VIDLSKGDHSENIVINPIHVQDLFVDFDVLELSFSVEVVDLEMK